MPSSYTDNLGLEKPATGEQENTWGSTLNTNFAWLDAAIADVRSKSVAGGADVALTTTEARSATIKLTGALTDNIAVIVPTAEKSWIIHNATTGDFTLTVKTSGGAGVAVARNEKARLYCDGTDVIRAWLLPIGDSFIINGDMAICQRTTPLAITTSSYCVDRFGVSLTGAGRFTLSQDTDVPTGQGALYSFKIDVTTADASLASTDNYLFKHVIEGYDVASLMQGSANSKTVVLSFWVKSPKTGTHCVALQNGAQDRSYIATYTVNTIDTWERKWIVITLDTTGTWLTTNGAGLIIAWSLGGGSNFQGSAGAWAAGNLTATSGQVNLVDDTANNIYFTLVKLETNDFNVPTAFRFGNYQRQLAQCQRYYHSIVSSSENTGLGSGTCPTTTAAGISYYLPVTMRAAPTFAVTDATKFHLADGASVADCTTITQASSDTKVSSLSASVASGLTAGHCANLSFNGGGSATISWDAELAL